MENIKAIYNKNKKTLSFKDRLGNIVLEEKEDGRLLQPHEHLFDYDYALAYSSQPQYGQTPEESEDLQ